MEKKAIKFIDKFYHFGTLSYNKSESSIVYTQVRPSLTYGYSYGFLSGKACSMTIIYFAAVVMMFTLSRISRYE